VVVGAEVSSCAEITELGRRWHLIGRLSVDGATNPPVDLLAPSPGR